MGETVQTVEASEMPAPAAGFPEAPAPAAGLSEAGGGHAVDMTRGPIWRQLAAFALPVGIGMLFQQLYSTVDGLVVGNFVGVAALGAVTGTTVVTWALVSLLIGLSTGASVVVAQCFGARDYEGVRRAVHTAVLAMGVLSLVFAALGVLVSPLMPRMLRMDASLVPDATVYLQVYCVGFPGLLLYDVGTGILRAVGDTRRPLYVLAATSALNVGLDVAFVVLLGWGVAGAAWATVASEAAAAAITLALLVRSCACYRLEPRRLAVDVEKLRKMASVGIPAGIQMAIISFSNVFVQAYVNGFGAAVTTGWGVDSRVDGFVFLTVQSLCLALTTFVGQNYGAGDLARIRRGTVVCRRLAVGCALVVCALCIAFAEPLAALFTPDEAARAYGVFFIRLFCLLDVVNVFNNVDQSALQGMGVTKVPTLISIGTFVVLRQAYLAVVSAMGGSLLAIALGFPVGWLGCSVIMHVYLRRCRVGRKVFGRDAA